MSTIIREKKLISKDNTVINGNGDVLVWDDHNGMVPGFGTGDSATLTITAKNVLIENLIIRNDFDYITGKQKRCEAVSKGMGLQAVALFVTEQACDIKFVNCTFESFQDTVFVDGKDIEFVDCTIKGNVDFIFGKGNAKFINCTIISLLEGIVTAPSTLETSPKGLEFINCSFTCEENVPTGSVYLARPWHPGGKPGVKSMVEFKNCSFGKHINKDYWTTMKDTYGVAHTPEESRFIL